MKAGLAIRAVGTVAVALVGWQLGTELGQSQPRNAILGLAIGAVLGLMFSPYVLLRPYGAVKRTIGAMPAGDFLYATLGLILGLIAAALLAIPLSFLPWWFGHVLPAVAAVALAYLGVSAMLLRRRDISRFLDSHFEGISGEPHNDGFNLLVDTSAIIDGRIADISETGFLRGTLVVPRFVLSELQHIADSPDALRRNRGRRGLDVLNKLQKESKTAVEITDADPADVPDVDGKLVKLGRQMHSPVVTNDFNLNRVAELQGVQVLNINLLAHALKPVLLPGEEMSVKVIQEGKEMNQGVGYLDDGTMIVVENGRRYMGREAEVVVTRVLQTVAGRMIFAQPKN